MFEYAFLCHTTGSIIVLPSIKLRFKYCPFCGMARFESWDGFQNIEGLTQTAEWLATHDWEEEA